MIDTIEKSFFTNFSCLPTIIVRSPGRINLIGEHTDYNHGFVLPAAIDKSIYIALSPRSDSEVHLQALDLKESHHFLKGGFKKTEKSWPNYILGVLQQLEKKGALWKGFNCAFLADLPIGAGLSSSAALECGILFGLNTLFNLSLTPRELARMAQAAENEFVGVQCGIMDQFANVFGKKDQLIKLDCSNQIFEYIPFEQDEFDLVLCDTGVKHGLASSEYNTRKKECETGVTALRERYPELSSLRSAHLQQLNAVKEKISETVYRRCKYVIEEIDRVTLACKDLKENHFIGFGQKMYATHEGLKNDYEVSCTELDFLVEQARRSKAVLGARMMGGGFGGCTINLVQKSGTSEFLQTTAEAYQHNFGRPLQSHLVKISDGVQLIK